MVWVIQSNLIYSSSTNSIISKEFEIQSLRLYDYSGKLAFQREGINSKEIPIPLLPNGFYIGHFVNTNGDLINNAISIVK